jgi:hypothetical protein
MRIPSGLYTQGNRWLIISPMWNGSHYDHINYAVDAGVEGLDEDPVALYLDYRDWE